MMRARNQEVWVKKYSQPEKYGKNEKYMRIKSGTTLDVPIPHPRIYENKIWRRSS